MDFKQAIIDELTERFAVSYKDATDRQMYEAYHDAAEQNHALIADAGRRFYELADTRSLYAEDGCHPNEEGSRIAAEAIASVIAEDQTQLEK